MRRYRRRARSVIRASTCMTPPQRRARRRARSLAHAQVLDDRRRCAPRRRRPCRHRLARRTPSHARSCRRARRDVAVVHVPSSLCASSLPPSPTATPTAVPAATARR
eukprot:597705-Prymnesium_polylepis.1